MQFCTHNLLKLLTLRIRTMVSYLQWHKGKLDPKVNARCAVLNTSSSHTLFWLLRYLKITHCISTIIYFMHWKLSNHWLNLRFTLGCYLAILEAGTLAFLYEGIFKPLTCNKTDRSSLASFICIFFDQDEQQFHTHCVSTSDSSGGK